MIKGTKALLLRIPLQFKSFDERNNILLFSEARAGSTWLAEMLHRIPGALINWEPLHPGEGVVPKTFNWGWRPYLSPEDATPHYLDFLRRILNLRASNRWTLKFCSLSDLLYGRIIITKFVRANLLAPWILKHADLHYKPIFLIRHPVAVCLSQMKAFAGIPAEDFARPANQAFQAPDCLHNERFLQNRNYLNKLETILERRIALWCINNLPALQHPVVHQKAIITFYEDLLLHPETELQRILQELGLEAHAPSVLSATTLRKASKTDFTKDYRHEPKQQMQKPMQELDEAMKVKIQRIFDYYGFELYAADDPYPKKEKWPL